MKRCLLILALLGAALYAQIQVLPDIEVSGDNQIKIHLYKKALPYSQESIARDSIMAFVPSSLPPLDLPQNVQAKPSYKHYLNLQGDSRPGLEADYKYYPASSILNDAEAMLSLRIPNKNMHSHHLRMGLDFAVDEGIALGVRLLHFDTEMKNLESKYSLAALASYQDRSNLLGLKFRQISNELRIYKLDQDNSGVTLEDKGLGFTHQNLLDFANFTWGNRFYFDTTKPALHSFIEAQQDRMDQFGIHILYDGYRFFPVPGFNWRYITDFDQEFSIVNQPEMLRNDYCELLDEYRWLSFDASRLDTAIPLNLKIALEDTHSVKDSFFLLRYLLANSTKYKVNTPVLRDSPNPDVPELYYSDVFSNESGLSASFGAGRVVFDQAILIDLSFMPNEAWVRRPYAPLLKVESALAYQSFPFEASIGLNQHYFALDHYQRSLPELLDLSINAALDLSYHSQVYLRVENLLNSPKWQFKSLPREDRSLYVGFVHRFR